MIIHRCSICGKELPAAWPHYTVFIKRTEQGFSVEHQKTIREYKLCEACNNTLLHVVEGFNK